MAGMMTTVQDDELDLAGRSTTLTGRKRRRGSTSPPRRTKSTSDALPLRTMATTASSSASTAQADREYKAGMLRTFVKGALTKSRQGDQIGYLELLIPFSPTPTNPDLSLYNMTPLLSALTSHISLLDSSLHSSLIQAILAAPWATAGVDREGDRFISSYTRFVGALVTTKGEWLEEALKRLVQGFRYQQSLRCSTEVTRPPTWSTFHDRHHTLLAHIHSLIPTLPLLLQTLLTKSFPHKRESELSLTVYARNVLRVVDWCPGVAARVWEVTLDRIIKLDVEIQIELDDIDDADEEEDEGEIGGGGVRSGKGDDEMLAMDDRPVNEDPARCGGEEDDEGDSLKEEMLIEDISSDEGSVDGLSDSSSETEDEAKYKQLRETKSKLDALLWQLFRHLSGLFGKGIYSSTSTTTAPTSASKSITAESRTNQFQILLGIFDRLILPTFQARRAQFLIFWLCSLSPTFTDLFLGLLVSRSLYQDEVPYVRRIAAASYIASFVSRASYVTDEQTRNVVHFLLAYVDGVVQEAKVNPAGLAREMGSLQIFYTVCQAVMMIFCFRWQALQSASARKVGGGKSGIAFEASPGLAPVDVGFVDGMELGGEMEEESDDGGGSTVGERGKWVAELDVLHGAILGPMNPLLACYPDVVEMFAKVAHATKLIFCYSLISANKEVISTYGSSASASNSQPTTPGLTGPTSSSLSTRNPMLSFPLNSRQALEESGLDCYFPFDPYDLPRSGRLIEPLYRQWSDVEKPFGGEGLLSPPQAPSTGARETDGLGSYNSSTYMGGSFSKSLSHGLLSSSLEGMRL